ncbi:MAG: hypothetical protein H6537_02980 [Bacteroidales bacterium]|nr:hypothetical protein [Bacteroidales bacterium]HPD96389.1 hypothetical protein [Tenuifilaceae bacterium]
MLEEIQNKISKYERANDIHQFQLILDAATIFIKTFHEGVKDNSELQLGIDLFKFLTSITMVTSLHQYEYNYDLQNEILYKKLAVFRLCIPDTHKQLRGLTEMLVGMKENEMDEIIKTF